jgi:hypothetical protein
MGQAKSRSDDWFVKCPDKARLDRSKIKSAEGFSAFDQHGTIECDHHSREE